MTWYRLTFGGVELGDELIVPVSSWRSTSRSGGESGSLEPILRLDDRPLAIAMYPRFKIRKVTDDFWEFERWLFDLVAWADGDPRPLAILDETRTMRVNYDSCKLVAVDRPDPSDAGAGRWSDQVIVTFQSDTIPTFYE